jgi:hypothetical protein
LEGKFNYVVIKGSGKMIFSKPSQKRKYSGWVWSLVFKRGENES